MQRRPLQGDRRNALEICSHHDPDRCFFRLVARIWDSHLHDRTGGRCRSSAQPGNRDREEESTRRARRLVEARSGYLPSLSSTGLVDKRQQQTETRLRDEDYNAILKLEQNLYTGGAVSSQVSIARLNIEKQNYELQETASRVAMDVRVAFNELLLNRAKVGVRQ